MQRDLVIRARDGDAEAFEALAAEAFGRLYRTAALILRSNDRAADAVQEALTAAWVHIRAVRDPERFDAWLHRLLVNACYGELRRAKRRSVMEIHLPTAEGRALGDAQDETALRDQLEGGFRRLTPEQRAVLVLHHYLGMSDSEAAMVLAIPLGTFKGRLHRATAAMRAALEAEERTQIATRESMA